MRPRFHLKIQTVLFISLAFIFRMAFVNVSALSSLHTSPANKYTNPYASTDLKKGNGAEVEALSTTGMYGAVEICEEITDSEEDLAALHAPLLLSTLYSLVEPISSVLRSSTPFDQIKCGLYPKIYLAFSVLRV